MKKDKKDMPAKTRQPGKKSNKDLPVKNAMTDRVKNAASQMPG